MYTCKDNGKCRSEICLTKIPEGQWKSVFVLHTRKNVSQTNVCLYVYLNKAFDYLVR